MKSHESHRRLALLLLSTAVAAETRAGSDVMREIAVEVLRLERSTMSDAGAAGEAAPIANLVGPPQVDAFVIRFKLEPGERVLLARGLLRDGLAHHASQPRKARRAARLLARLGFTVATREIPGDLMPGVGSLAGLLLPLGEEPAAPRAARVLVLRAGSFITATGMPRRSSRSRPTS